MITEDILQLRNLGLTEGEIKVYAALLRLGEATKTMLAKESCIAPANLYDITNRLAEKGIISIVTKNGVKHFMPSDPRHLLDFLEQKKEEIAKEETLVSAILPSLQAAFQEKKAKTKIEVFTGWNGLKTVFLDLIDECTAKEQNFVYGASASENKSYADQFFLKYSMMRARKGIHLNVIFNEDVRKRKERIDFFIKSRQCAVRFLKQTTPTEIMIYKDVAVILILTYEPMAIRIRERRVAESFKQHFDLMWALAKE